MDTILTLSNNPSILNEISRIKEMMGVKTANPLNESVGSSVADMASKLSDIVRTMLNRSDFSNMNLKGINFTKSDFQRLIHLLGDYSGRINQAETKTKQLLGILISEDAELSKEFYKSYLTRQLQVNQQNEVQIIQKLIEKLKGESMEFDTALRNLLKKDENSDIIYYGIRDSLYRQYETFTQRPNDFVTTLGSGSKKRLDKGEMKKLRRVINKKTPKLFVKDFFTLFRRYASDIKDEISALNEGYITDVAQRKLKPVGDDGKAVDYSDLTEAYSVQITRLLNALEYKANDAAATVLDDFGLDKEITDMIKEGDVKFFQIFRETWEKSGEGVGEMFLDVLRSFKDDIIETVKSLFTKGEMGNTLASLLDPRTSVGQFMYTAQFAGLNKQYLALIRTSAGQSKTNKAKYAGLYFAQSLVGYYISWAVLSVAEFIYDILLGIFQATWNSALELFAYLTGKDSVLDKKLDLDIWLTKGIGSLVYDRVSVITDWLKNKEGENSIWGYAVDMIETWIPGGMGTVQDGLLYTIIDYIIERGSEGRYDMDTYKGPIQQLIKQFSSLIGFAETVAYNDTEDSFKNFIRNLPNKDDFMWNSIDVVEGDDGKNYYNIKLKNNQGEQYYLYDKDKDTFIVP